jgi:hypothetical protein
MHNKNIQKHNHTHSKIYSNPQKTFKTYTCFKHVFKACKILLTLVKSFTSVSKILVLLVNFTNVTKILRKITLAKKTILRKIQGE